MQTLEDLPTPAVLIDLDILACNIANMQERARAAGVKLRPHAKTHKSPEVGRMQIAAGASGLTLAKTSEAEVFAAHGFDDIFLGYPIFGADKARRLLALADRVRLAVGVDSVEGARSLGDVFHAAGRRLDVRLKIDSGFRRVGVRPEDAVAMARRIAELPGVALAGIFTHAGHGYGGPTPEDVARTGGEEGRIVVEAAEAVRAAGLPVEDVSLGSTPTVRAGMVVAGVTECRPGSYVYNDRSQVALGSAAARGLRDDHPRDRRQRSGARPRGRGCRIEDALDGPDAPERRRQRPRRRDREPHRARLGGARRHRRRRGRCLPRRPARADPARTTPAPFPTSTTAWSPSGAGRSRAKSVWRQGVASSRSPAAADCLTRQSLIDSVIPWTTPAARSRARSSSGAPSSRRARRRRSGC